MRRKQRKVWWRVAGHEKSGRFLARHPAGAVAQFRRAFHLPIKSDRINGTWPGVHVVPFPLKVAAGRAFIPRIGLKLPGLLGSPLS